MNLRPRDRIVLGAILILATIAGFYMLVLTPQKNTAASLTSKIAAQRQALTQEQSAYAAGRAAQSSLRAGSAQWAALNRAVPNTSDIPALLRVLERNADAVHVKMTAIQLSAPAASAAPAAPVTPATPATPGSATGASAAAAAPAATSVPLQLTFSGGYRALNNLVRRLDGLVVVSGTSVHASGPLLSISNVSLSGAPKLTVQLTATIYQLGTASSSTSASTGGQS
jgi:hypothetical protein